MKKRCEWLTDDEIYLDYHDKEWGVPVYDDFYAEKMAKWTDKKIESLISLQ